MKSEWNDSCKRIDEAGNKNKINNFILINGMESIQDKRQLINLEINYLLVCLLFA